MSMGLSLARTTGFFYRLMAVGGLGWLTVLVPSLARELVPYTSAPGIVGESLLTLWLLVTGARVARR